MPCRLSRPAILPLANYVLIGLFLSLVTLVEFLIILPQVARGSGWVIAPLALLSAVKFAAVLAFYMHLKFDHRLLTWIFLGGFALSFAMVMALVGLFGAYSPSGQPRALAAVEPPWCPTPVPKPTPVPEPTPVSEPTAEPLSSLAPAGEQIFITGAGQGAATPCVTCHTVEGVNEAVGLLGPDLSHIGTEAANRQPGLSAEDYLEQSIREPEAFIPEGVYRAVPGLMLNAITAGLTDEDVEALVAFLLAQQ